MQSDKIELREIEFKEINETNFSDVQVIYAQGLATKNATFETSVPDWEKWNRSHTTHSRVVAIYQHKIIGWGSLSPVSDRCVYEGVAEVSVYIHQDYIRRGIGKIVMNKIIEESEANGIWSIMSGVFPENKASIELHLQTGFRIIGIREKIAQLDGIWRDTVLLQRRSLRVGI